MYEPPQGYAVAFKTTGADECAELRLVLMAMGIHAKTVHHNGKCFLTVRQDDLAIATEELDAYRRENPDWSSDKRHDVIKPVPQYGGAVVAVITYWAIIILIDFLADHFTFGRNWFQAGQMEAGRVRGGEWWRVVTALTLHTDAEHLLSNVLFGAVFGYLAARILGGGTAWLAISVAGALGNLMNAIVQPPLHTSIGASTAVFAALGLIVSHSLRNWTTTQPNPKQSQNQSVSPLKRWSPLIGGALLLAFLGVGGEHTDVIAHITGFFAGLLIGWLGCRLPERWLAMRAFQAVAGIGAIALVASAWLVALTATR